MHSKGINGWGVYLLSAKICEDQDKLIITA